jgi:hypothetical protein
MTSVPTGTSWNGPRFFGLRAKGNADHLVEPPSVALFAEAATGD